VRGEVGASSVKDGGRSSCVEVISVLSMLRVSDRSVGSLISNPLERLFQNPELHPSQRDQTYPHMLSVEQESIWYHFTTFWDDTVGD